MINRRRVLRRLTLLGASAGLVPALGQPQPKRIGILSEARAAASGGSLIWEPGFWPEMARRGWVVGQNVVVERALADGNTHQLPQLAAELVHKGVDLILCLGDQEAMVAAARATQTVPIVVFDVSDPVEQGLVRSLARPGRNVTGISLSRGAELPLKRLELLREAAPSARRLCWLWDRGPSLTTRVDGSRFDVAAMQAEAARRLQFEARIYRVNGQADIDKAFADAAAWPAQALTTSGLAPFLARREVTRFALRQRLPSVFPVADFVEEGGLLFYGVADAETQLLFTRWADYIDRVLRGAKPADMPVIGADRYELKVNTSTAEALGLNLPPSILMRADALLR